LLLASGAAGSLRKWEAIEKAKKKNEVWKKKKLKDKIR
jgi:hypothetical protein